MRRSVDANTHTGGASPSMRRVKYSLKPVHQHVTTDPYRRFGSPGSDPPLASKASPRLASSRGSSSSPVGGLLATFHRRLPGATACAESVPLGFELLLST